MLATELAAQVVRTTTPAAALVARTGAYSPVPIEESASRANFVAFRSALFDDDLQRLLHRPPLPALKSRTLRACGMPELG